jgi:hypothetical protein
MQNVRNIVYSPLSNNITWRSKNGPRSEFKCGKIFNFDTLFLYDVRHISMLRILIKGEHSNYNLQRFVYQYRRDGTT